jgi:exopolysaccharide biosynthesis polyprenyl glycosylphosphotransferase
MGSGAAEEGGGVRRTAILAGMILDAAAVVLALLLATWLKFSSGMFPATLPIGWNVLFAGAAVSILYWLGVFSASACYTLHWDRSWTDELRLVVKPVTFGTLFLAALTFVASPGLSLGRWIIVFYYLLLLILVFASRGIARLAERRMANRGALYRIAAVIGTGPEAARLVHELEESPALGYRIVGFIEPDESGPRSVEEGRIIGSVKHLDTLIAGMGIEELLVTIASNFHQDILSLLLPATSAGVRVKVVPDLFDVIAGHVHNTQILGEQLMELLPVRLSFWQRTIKALMDRVLAFVVLTAGLPVWAAVALVIRLESRGPVFYRQDRVGQGGVRFRIFKFRSMIRDAEKHTGPVWAGKDDPRITRVGAVLRKTRLDEIPQFINVILGEMSVVGPRPERPRFVEELRTVYPFYDKRLTVKPGITGWAQVKLEYDTSIEDVAEKLKLDFYYIENMSLYLDLEILARTLVVVLTGRGAH